MVLVKMPLGWGISPEVYVIGIYQKLWKGDSLRGQPGKGSQFFLSFPFLWAWFLKHRRQQPTAVRHGGDE